MTSGQMMDCVTFCGLPAPDARSIVITSDSMQSQVATRSIVRPKLRGS